MKIGIDIDGVLTNEHDFIINNAAKFFDEKNIQYKIDEKIYDSPRIFGVTEEEYNSFWKEHFLDYLKNTLIRPYANEAIKKLKDENHEIIIITARSFSAYKIKHKESMQEITKQWLNKNGVVYDEIIFSENKAEICNKLNVDVMIEDKPENIMSVSEVAPVICYNHPFNEEISSDNIYRCYNWQDIYKIIHSIERE